MGKPPPSNSKRAGRLGSSRTGPTRCDCPMAGLRAGGPLKLRTASQPRMDTDEHGLRAGCLTMGLSHGILCRKLCRKWPKIDKVCDKGTKFAARGTVSNYGPAPNG